MLLMFEVWYATPVVPNFDVIVENLPQEVPNVLRKIRI